MLSILGLLTGLAGPLSSITGKISDLLVARAQARTDQERMKVDQQIEEAHDRKAILVAEAGNRVAGTINASMRLALAVGPAAILLKLMLWDKVIGSFAGCAGSGGHGLNCASFRTDPLDTNQWMVITAVIAFYFAYDMMARSRKP